MPDGSAQNIATGLAGGLIVIALRDRPGGGQTRPATRRQLAEPGQDHGGAGSRQHTRRNAARLLFGATLTRTDGDRGAVLNISAALIPRISSAAGPDVCADGRAALTNSSKAQREVCATGRAVLDADGRGMGIGDALDDRKSQPRVSRPSPVAPPEALKNQLALILFDSRTLIENPHHAVALDDDLHGRSRRRIVDGVLDKITDRS